MPQGKGTYGTTRGRPPKTKPRRKNPIQKGALGNIKNPTTGLPTYPESLRSEKTVQRSKKMARAATIARSTVTRKKPVRRRPK